MEKTPIKNPKLTLWI